MKTKIAFIIVIIITIISLGGRVKRLKTENASLKSNQESLLTERDLILSENQKYKIADSLNAAKVSQLELSLKEYKRYRASDLQLIEQLKISSSGLEKVVSSQTETITKLRAGLTDSIRYDYDTGLIHKLKHFEYKSKWTDVSGLIDMEADSVDLSIANRESLIIVESVKYKRFLGFLWHTGKIKSKEVDVVSENPATSIINIECISIKK